MVGGTAPYKRRDGQLEKSNKERSDKVFKSLGRHLQAERLTEQQRFSRRVLKDLGLNTRLAAREDLAKTRHFVPVLNHLPSSLRSSVHSLQPAASIHFLVPSSPKGCVSLEPREPTSWWSFLIFLAILTGLNFYDLLFKGRLEKDWN